jgi:hypothetical protein
MFQMLQQVCYSKKTLAIGSLFLVGFMLGGCAGVGIPDPAVRYIAFGDSTTSGPNDQNYWNFLAEKIGQSADRFANEGNGGEGSSEGLDRLKNLIEQGLYPNAKILLYWQGGDDLIGFIKNRDPLLTLSPNTENYPYASQLDAELDRIQANIEQSITIAQDAGLDVYVTTYYFLKENKQCKPAVLDILLAPQADIANVYLDKLNDRIRLAAQNTGSVLVDVETQSQALLSDPANYADCNHLSDQGNRIVADVFFAVLVPVTD